MSIFDQQIVTDNHGMAGGQTHYDIEDIYQAFKARLIAELAVSSEELLHSAELFDATEDNSNE